LDLFDLTTNPFAVLGLTPRDNADAIARAVEALLADPAADEGRVRRAQQNLMAPRPRLQAELAWLIGVAPSRAQAILGALSRDDLDALISALPDAPGLARANLAAHLAHQRPSKMIIETLIAAYDEIAHDELTAIINAERVVARLPRVPADLVDELLRTVREQHLEAAQEAIIADSHPGRLMTRLVEGWLDAESPARDFLEALAERYDRWSTPVLGRIEERLDAAADRLRAHPKRGEALEEIVRTLSEWDEYSQPRQLLFGQKRLDEPRAKRLADKLRSLAVWLANERQEYQRALVISKALLVVFPELPSVHATLQDDLQTLEGLVRQSEETALLADLSGAVETARACPSFGSEIERGDFGPVGCGVSGRLYTASVNAARRAVGHEHAIYPGTRSASWRSSCITITTRPRQHSGSLTLFCLSQRRNRRPKSPRGCGRTRRRSAVNCSGARSGPCLRHAVGRWRSNGFVRSRHWPPIPPNGNRSRRCVKRSGGVAVAW
jgi:hypothetical protein